MKTGIFATILAAAAILRAQQQPPARERYNPQTMKQIVRGTTYGVSSMHQLASLAADRILQRGGNAFDAAVAGQAVLGVVEPGATGIGGDAQLLVYDAKAGKVWSINAEGTAPKLATIEWYRTNQGGKIPANETLLSGTAPGVVDAWYTLLSRWGTLGFEEVLAPAIELAQNGFPTQGRLMREIQLPLVLGNPALTKLYAPNGHILREGEIFRNPNLARTMRRIVDAEKAAKANGRQAALLAGRDRFYKGDIAREMEAASIQNGGLFRYEDFASYAAKVEEPVSSSYRGYRVYKNPSASAGPAELFMLNILEGYDLAKMGLNTADFLHLSIEACKLAMADRDKYLGDMDFIKIPYKGLLSKEYAAERRKLIDMTRASLEFRPGDAEAFEPGFAKTEHPVDFTTGGNDHEGDTSYIATADKDRNAVSFTPSVHSSFGTKVVMGELGFTFNCRGDYYSLVPGHANALAPGKRPRSTLQGTLVLKDGRPWMLTGSPGGDDQPMRTVQTLINMVDFGMNIQQAIEAPRWTTTSFPASTFPHRMNPGAVTVESRIPEGVRTELLRRGHRISVAGAWTLNSSGGIHFDWTQGGMIEAAADPRVFSTALAW
jgi:gamma-glutamyltranspeptidase/glutathione hydrolase